MNKQSLDALAVRLERLERECWVWRRASMVFALGAFALLSGGAGEPPPRAIEEINVKRVVVRDDQGREAITLGTQEGVPVLALLADGQERMTIAAPGGTPVIAFVDAGKPRLSFGLSSSGSPVVNFIDSDEHRRISLGIFPKVGALISILDEKNKVIFRTP